MPKHVMLVCTGNICRSAMAEIVLLDRLLAAGVRDVRVSSAGVSAEEQGNPMDYRAVKVLRENGYGQPDTPAHREIAARIAAHSAHRITDEEIADADLILAMTRAHYQELQRRAARVDGAGSIRLFREFDPLLEDAGLADADSSAAAGSLGMRLDVPDPWYGGLSDFLETLETVERVSDNLVRLLAS